jgi:hypothetical protein
MIYVGCPPYESRKVDGGSTNYEGAFGIVREVPFGSGIDVRPVEETLVFDEVDGDIGSGQARFH